MFRKWLTSRGGPKGFTSEIVPHEPFIALGDIHGCVDLLTRFLRSEPAHRVVCLGDYVDRGDHSAQVLRLLKSRPEIICLKGNHEDMLLNFLSEPQIHGPRWLRHGGLQTLASFGISGISDATTGAALDGACDTLRSAMGEELIRWIADLPTYYMTGNVVAVHAGADPAQAIPEQSERVLIWGHPQFRKTPRRDGVWVVHGHTIMDQAHTHNGVISIDTGAYATGRLTAATISADGVRFDTA